MRVSDTERQRTIDELRRHCASGRLDVDEYAGRIEKAMVATTLEELDALTSDLPMVRIADPAGYRPAGHADGGAARSIGAAARDWANGRSAGAAITNPADAARRLGSSAIILMTVILVTSVVLLAILASWAWAAVLLAGWLVGLLQGRAVSRRR